MTYSIGMRAPTVDELRCSFEREYPDAENPFTVHAADQQVFYSDVDLRCDESAPGQVSERAIDRCRKMIDSSVGVGDRQLAIALGCAVTDLKPWLCPDSATSQDIVDVQLAVCAGQPVVLHGMAKIAWCSGDGGALVFANGSHRQIPQDQLASIKCLSASRRLGSAATLEEGLLLWLIKCRVFDNTDNTDLL